jgi:hypothetical protein
VMHGHRAADRAAELERHLAEARTARAAACVAVCH